MLLALAPLGAMAQPAAPIPVPEIAALEQELAQGVRQASSVDIRRACKSVIRKVDSLLEANPGAPNRYAALELLFDGQKRLLTLEATESNRKAIYETCASFIDAPDEYAETRFDADMMLSERDLAEADATVAERLTALEGMLAKYRGTEAEWKSLLVGSLIATRLLDFDLEKKISDTMFERFCGDHKVIEFRRKKNMGGQIDAVFSGTYKSSGGVSYVFPNDFMGHQYVLYFWSQATPDIDKHLAAVKELQVQHPGRFDVYSFNVDELPDAGAKKLRKLGLDWTAMHLPGGRKSSTFRAYTERDPNVVFVNGQGHVLLVSPPKELGMTAVTGISQGVLGGWNFPGIAKGLDNNRYLAQLRSLFIGDFLAGSGEWRVASGKDLGPEMQAIQACFTPPPLRYRLTQKESLANYRKAEKLCASAIKKHSKSADLWAVRNRRIISLIGMWNLARDPKHLHEAVKEAKTVLAMDLPPGADVAARLCLAKKALRDADADPEALLSGLIKEVGGDKTPSALAAAAILALESSARTAHGRYRQQLLTLDDDAKPLDVCAFLRDKHHRYRNFWASPGGYGFGRPQKYKFRDTVAGLEMPEERDRRIECEVTRLDGGTFRLPQAAAGKMLGVLFAEPPAETSVRSNLVNAVNSFGGTFTNRGVQVAVVLLSDDTNTVRSLAEDLRTGFRVGMLPGGLKNPLVRQLGILSADRVPNPLLLRPDGTVAWTISGINYAHFRSGPHYAIERAIETNIQKVRSDVAFENLVRGDFRLALKQFDEYVPRDPWRGRPGSRDWWTSDRHQGRALAYMGLKDWNKALPAIDAALDQRKADFKSAICKCHGLVEMYLTKAMILEKLNRGSEAAEQRRLAARERLPHSKLPPGNARAGVPVGVYYDQLKEIRLGLEGKGE